NVIEPAPLSTNDAVPVPVELFGGVSVGPSIVAAKRVPELLELPQAIATATANPTTTAKTVRMFASDARFPQERRKPGPSTDFRTAEDAELMPRVRYSKHADGMVVYRNLTIPVLVA